MIRPYRYTVDAAVLAVFGATTKGQREKLLRMFAQLADNPHLPGDRIQHDNVGRPLQIKRFGHWTITYWSEHLDNQVHIIAVEHLRA